MFNFHPFRKHNQRTKRRFISPSLGVKGFFENLNESRVCYVVLRWGDRLPMLDPGEDIDLLVSDDDLPNVEKFLRGNRRSGIPVDLYSASGLPGTNFRGLPYYPPRLAELILANAEVLPNGVRQATATYLFYSMIYHVLFHKGFESNLESDLKADTGTFATDHDYLATLRSLGDRCGVVQEKPTLEGYLALAEAKGWCPPLDTLEKLSTRNDWVRQRFFPSRPRDERFVGLGAYFIRERAVTQLESIRVCFREQGFEVLDEFFLSPVQTKDAYHYIRGGNWHRGPWPVSGGSPAYVFIVFDVFPKVPTAGVAFKHAGIDNERGYHTKLSLRKLINRSLPRRSRMNGVHSSDNAQQAFHYLEVLGYTEQALERLKAHILARRAEVELPSGYHLVCHLSGHGRRSISRLVKRDSTFFVCKTYRAGMERFIEREVAARSLAGEFAGMVVPLWQHLGSHLLFPYIADNVKGWRPSLNDLERIKDFILHYRRHGYELVDFKPSNILFSQLNGIQIFDFEFLQHVRPVNKLVGCYCWYGVPSNIDIDRPLSNLSSRNVYNRHWLRFSLLPRCIMVIHRPRTPLRLLSLLWRKILGA